MDANTALGLQLMRLDQVETAAHAAFRRGLYIAPNIPQPIALYVALVIAVIAREART